MNHFFQNCVPLPNYDAERLEPVREEAGPAPEWRLLDLEDKHGQAGKLRELAAWETARLIAEHRTQSSNGDNAYSDIVVLVRTHDELDLLLPLLEEAGIPVVSSGAKTFYQQPEVLDALNLLIVAQNPQTLLRQAPCCAARFSGCRMPKFIVLTVWLQIMTTSAPD